MSSHSKNKKGTFRKKAIDSVLLRSRRIFSEAYADKERPSALIAREGFDEMILTGEISPEDGHRFLSNKGWIQEFLEKAEESYQNKEFGQIRKILLEVAGNTSTPKTIAIATAVSAAFFVLTSLVSPFTNGLLQPSVDEIFKRAPKGSVMLVAPQQVPQTIINNYNYYYFNQPAARNEPKRKPVGKKSKPRAKPSPAP